jgi:hypothetical protein
VIGSGLSHGLGALGAGCAGAGAAAGGDGSTAGGGLTGAGLSLHAHTHNNAQHQLVSRRMFAACPSLRRDHSPTSLVLADRSRYARDSLEVHMPIDTMNAWHELVKSREPARLDALLADSAVFHSPIVHRPQVGKDITKMYLLAAFQVFFRDSFRYVRELRGERDAVLEFEVEIDGIRVNGVDMIKWNDDGQIVEFKVMLRPLKAIQLIHERMGAMLKSLG